MATIFPGLPLVFGAGPPGRGRFRPSADEPPRPGPEITGAMVRGVGGRTPRHTESLMRPYMGRESPSALSSEVLKRVGEPPRKLTPKEMLFEAEDLLEQYQRKAEAEGGPGQEFAYPHDIYEQLPLTVPGGNVGEYARAGLWAALWTGRYPKTNLEMGVTRAQVTGIAGAPEPVPFEGGGLAIIPGLRRGGTLSRMASQLGRIASPRELPEAERAGPGPLPGRANRMVDHIFPHDLLNEIAKRHGHDEAWAGTLLNYMQEIRDGSGDPRKSSEFANSPYAMDEHFNQLLTEFKEMGPAGARVLTGSGKGKTERLNEPRGWAWGDSVLRLMSQAKPGEQGRAAASAGWRQHKVDEVLQMIEFSALAEAAPEELLAAAPAESGPLAGAFGSWIEPRDAQRLLAVGGPLAPEGWRTPLLESVRTGKPVELSKLFEAAHEYSGSEQARGAGELARAPDDPYENMVGAFQIAMGKREVRFEPAGSLPAKMPSDTAIMVLDSPGGIVSSKAISQAEYYLSTTGRGSERGPRLMRMDERTSWGTERNVAGDFAWSDFRARLAANPNKWVAVLPEAHEKIWHGMEITRQVLAGEFTPAESVAETPPWERPPAIGQIRPPQSVVRRAPIGPMNLDPIGFSLSGRPVEPLPEQGKLAERGARAIAGLPDEAVQDMFRDPGSTWRKAFDTFKNQGFTPDESVELAHYANNFRSAHGDQIRALNNPATTGPRRSRGPGVVRRAMGSFLSDYIDQKAKSPVGPTGEEAGSVQF